MSNIPDTIGQWSVIEENCVGEDEKNKLFPSKNGLKKGQEKVLKMASQYLIFGLFHVLRLELGLNDRQNSAESN